MGVRRTLDATVGSLAREPLRRCRRPLPDVQFRGESCGAEAAKGYLSGKRKEA
jgi:hypothetical protein